MKTPAILVTGASGVIGSAVVKLLALDPGLRLVTPARSELDLSDRSDQSDLSGKISSLVQAEAPWKGAFLAAGVNHDLPLARLSAEEWDRQWQVNFTSCRLFLDAFLQSKSLADKSSLVLVSSVVGRRGNAGQAAYAAAKGALMDLMEAYQSRVAAAGGRLNVLFPPLVESPLLAGLSAEARESLFAQRLLRDPDPAFTCASQAAFLLSPDASYVHASVWHPDSRMTASPWD